MSLLKRLSLATLSLVAIFSFALVTLAENVNPVNKLEPVDCFSPGLYKFQSVQVSVGPEKASYVAGEVVNFIGNVVNQNSYPVVDGNVFVRIGKVNSNYMYDGHNTVAELIALSNLSVDASSSLPVSFTWTVPKDLGAGDYQASYFFSVGNKFNLGGLPFTNEIIVGFANFKVTNTKGTEFTIDRTATQVNGLKYNHIGNWPTINAGEKIDITQPIKNLTNKEIKVNVNYDLFFWDSLNLADKLNSKTETIIIPANSSKVLTYSIPKSEQSVYYLRITATVGDASSIVNIRTTSDIVKARINYPAITAFPLIKGDTANLFSCFHTTGGMATNSKLVLSLTDKSGNLVARGEYNGDINSAMSAATMKFIAGKNYTFLNLSADLLNEQGKVVDNYKTTYDCATLKSEKCAALAEKVVGMDITLFTLILLLITLVGLFVITKFIKPSILKKVFVVIFALLLIISLVVLILVFITDGNKVGAARATNETKVDTETKSVNYLIKGGASECRLVVSGNVGITYSATLVGDTSLAVGNNISFTTNESCAFNGVGGAWDTPTCGTAMTFNNGDIHMTGSLTLTNGVTGKSLVSSNPAVLSCTGFTCRAIATGTATVTVNFNDTNVRISDIWWKVADGTRYIGDVCIAEDSAKPGYDPLNNVTSWTIAGHHPSWVFTVGNSTAPTLNNPHPSCGATTANLSWNPGSWTISKVRLNDITNSSAFEYTLATCASGAYTNGDLCFDGVTGNSYTANVVPGHNYLWWLWLDGFGLSTSTAKLPFSVTNCTATTTPINGGGDGGDGGDNDDPIAGSSCNPNLDRNCFDGTLFIPDTRLNCVSLTSNPTSPVNVNTQTIFTANSSISCPTCNRFWTITDADGSISTTSAGSLNKIFTTVGQKTITARIASTTIYKVGSDCSTTTNVVMSGGSIIER